MKNSNKITILMVEENIHGREMILRLLENDLLINSVIVEKDSVLAENCKNYLKNNFYNPPSMYELLKDSGIPVYFVKNHNNEKCRDILQDIDPDILVLGGARILKKDIFSKARKGTINVHPGLLPGYRGVDVVAWQIYDGAPIGATCHFIDEKADSGPLLMKRELKYEKGSSLLEIRVQNMKLCAELLVDTLKNFCNIKPEIQDESKTKICPAIDQEALKRVEEILDGKA